MIKKPEGDTVFINYYTGGDSVVKANLTFTFNKDKLKKKLARAQEFLAQRIKKDTEEYVPAKSGRLYQTAYIRNNNTQIVYDTPYARYQYAGNLMIDGNGRTWVRRGEHKPIVTFRKLNHSKAIHPKATYEWFEKAKADKKEKWIKEIKELVNNG